ncbi:MAG: hypothetical protein ABIQ18_09970 [Umezawaea sp.]
MTPWWQEVSTARTDELVAAVADPVWQKKGIRLEFDENVTREHAYGVAIFQIAGCGAGINTASGMQVPVEPGSRVRS